VKVFCAVGLAIMGLGIAADLKLFNPRFLADRYDGTYVCADGAAPVTIRLMSGSGFIDMGFVTVHNMRADWHGSTLSLSGGNAYDAEGRSVDGEARRALTGGNDVDVLTLGNDGQTLALYDPSGGTMVFTKQSDGR
jgi:hypothetical protein